MKILKIFLLILSFNLLSHAGNKQVQISSIITNYLLTANSSPLVDFGDIEYQTQFKLIAPYGIINSNTSIIEYISVNGEQIDVNDVNYTFDIYNPEYFDGTTLTLDVKLEGKTKVENFFLDVPDIPTDMTDLQFTIEGNAIRITGTVTSLDDIIEFIMVNDARIEVNAMTYTFDGSVLYEGDFHILVKRQGKSSIEETVRF
jgi:hypothetical protein